MAKNTLLIEKMKFLGDFYIMNFKILLCNSAPRISFYSIKSVFLAIFCFFSKKIKVKKKSHFELKTQISKDTLLAQGYVEDIFQKPSHQFQHLSENHGNTG